jgi:hypothetical protein
LQTSSSIGVSDAGSLFQGRLKCVSLVGLSDLRTVVRDRIMMRARTRQ